MPNFIEIGGVTRKPLVDLTRIGQIDEYKVMMNGRLFCSVYDVVVNTDGYSQYDRYNVE